MSTPPTERNISPGVQKFPNCFEPSVTPRQDVTQCVYRITAASPNGKEKNFHCIFSDGQNLLTTNGICPVGLNSEPP